jgi:hypothetical protein
MGAGKRCEFGSEKKTSAWPPQNKANRASGEAPYARWPFVEPSPTSYCNNRGAYPEGIASIEQSLFPLTRHEAQRIGINVR